MGGPVRHGREHVAFGMIEGVEKLENSRHGQILSVGYDDEQVWSDREVRIAVEEARREGWNLALKRVGLLGGRRGGLGGGEESGDLRRLVGERFASGLEAVWLASLRYLRSSVPGDGGRLHGRMGSGIVRPATGLTDRALRMKGAKGGAGGQGRGKGVPLGVGGVVVDEEALAFKAGVDRKIRKLTREMENWLVRRSSNREENVVRRCKKCRRFGEESWQFCPFDGREME
jgi:hypothetical protein